MTIGLAGNSRAAFPLSLLPLVLFLSFPSFPPFSFFLSVPLSLSFSLTVYEMKAARAVRTREQANARKEIYMVLPLSENKISADYTSLLPVG